MEVHRVAIEDLTWPEWRPIETAPQNEEIPVLLWYDFRPLTGDEVYGIDLCRWNWNHDCFMAESPGAGMSCGRAPSGYSHWMPLPSPPTK